MGFSDVSISELVPIRHCFALYLPQFHAIPENDQWWGPGFTEWTQLREARGWHPRQVIQTPGEFGWYDLGTIDIMDSQYKLARDHGIDTFAFWHYWFGDNDLLLEGPAEQLLASDLDVRFCLAWANHDWVHKAEKKILKRQTYSQDPARHFAYLEPFFHDPRYRRIGGKPVFMVYEPRNHPGLAAFTEGLSHRAQASGLGGINFIFDRTRPDEPHARLCDYFFDAASALKFQPFFLRALTRLWRRMSPRAAQAPELSEYADCATNLNRNLAPRQLPVVFPGWDTTIRYGAQGLCLLDNNPGVFAESLERVAEVLSGRRLDDRIIIVKSWNEWAEGNILEPSREYGRSNLKAFAARFCLQDGTR